MNAKEDPTWTAEVPDISHMATPVRCTHSVCGRVYDLAAVTRTRTGSSATWPCPHCGELVDDREETTAPWKSMAHYVRLDRS